MYAKNVCKKYIQRIYSKNISKKYTPKMLKQKRKIDFLLIWQENKLMKKSNALALWYKVYIKSDHNLSYKLHQTAALIEHEIKLTLIKCK